MSKERHKRSLLNPLVDRRARLRLLAPFAILIGAILLIGYSMNQTISAIGDQFSRSLSAENPEAIAQFNQLIAKVKSVVAIDIAFLAVLALLLWAYYSFRIYGPLVAIYRHLRALIEGNYDSRVKLRRHDEFSKLSDQLNQLAQVLKERGPK